MAYISSSDTPNISLIDAATLVALTLKRSTNKAGRPRIRIRMSYKTFRLLTGRRIGGASFAREFTKELMNLGWLMVRTPSAYGFVRAASLAKWPLTKSGVIAEELKLIGEGSLKEALENARQELGGSGDVDSSSNNLKGPTGGKEEKKKRLAR